MHCRSTVKKLNTSARLFSYESFVGGTGAKVLTSPIFVLRINLLSLKNFFVDCTRNIAVFMLRSRHYCWHGTFPPAQAMHLTGEKCFSQVRNGVTIAKIEHAIIVTVIGGATARPRCRLSILTGNGRVCNDIQAKS